MNKSIIVVGGAYGEDCAFPRRQVFRGSGGRASAILKSLGADVRFVTVTGPNLGAEFSAIATRLGYVLDAKTSKQDIWFRYRYPLGKPIVHPTPIISCPESTPIVSELALVFGMVEGRIPVKAQRVVYDPQDGANAKPFSQNGSTADELAIVLSYSEGKALTGQSDPSAMAHALLADKYVSVVIVKCGPQGALVQTPSSNGWVRPFPTNRVYKIGSGDVFSSAFAYAWLVEKQEPISAAWFASRMTAAYVESSQDRFTPVDIEDCRAEARTARRKYGSKHARPIPEKPIYLAAPFFSTAQQWQVDEVRDALTDMGFRVFSPIHDVGVGPPEEVAPADLAALDGAGLVLALIDGTDAGTLFEVGYARAKNIPVVAIAESVDAVSMTMILGSGCYVTNDLTTGIYAACWHLMGDV